MHQFDKNALSAFLAERIDNFGQISSIEKFKDGQSNPTYHVKTSGKDFVLRAKPPGPLLKSAHQIDREYRVMAALFDTDVPVPNTYYLSDEDSPIGTMFFVMEMVEGRIFWDPALPQLSKAERHNIYGAMGKTLADLHGVDPIAVGLSGFGREGNYYARQLGIWTRQYRAAEMEKHADVDWLVDWLNEHLIEDDGTAAIVHGDYRIDNMIFNNDQSRIIALLDWELCTLGHPMADVAYQCMQWRLPSVGGVRGLGGVDRVALGIPLEEEYLADYCARRDIGIPSHWTFCLVFSYFRLLSIIQGVVHRALEGNASNPDNLQTMCKAVPSLANDARLIADAS